MPPGPGLLFDLDGTLVETDPVHFAAFNDILGRNGKPLIDQHTYDTTIIGCPNADIFARLFPDRSEEDQRRLADEKEALFRSRAGELRPLPGLLALLDWADGNGVPVAVVTNAPRANARMMLSTLGLADRLGQVVIGEELTHPKPHPMPYLTGIDLIRSKACRTLAFEDSRSGVRSASAAGLTVVGMTTSLTSEDLRAAGAHETAPDFTDARLIDLVRRTTGIG